MKTTYIEGGCVERMCTRILTLKQRLATALTMRPPMSLTLALMIVAVAILVVVVEELQSPHDYVAVYNLILLLLRAPEL